MLMNTRILKWKDLAPIDGRNIAIPTQHIKRTASGKVGAAKRPRAVLGKPNTFIRRTSSGGQILQKGPAQERAAQDALSASTAGAHTEAAALLRRRGQGGAAADGAEL